MYVKLTTQEKLKDLRVARKLTLKDLEEATGISSSTLGEYENNEYKDITSHSLILLSNFYGVSVDYLLGITENDIEANTPIEELHLTDDAIAVLKSGKINTRLLSEMITHPTFRKLMTNSEIYVDRLIDGQLRDMNTMLEAKRQLLIKEEGADPNNILMQTLSAAQISNDDFFGSVINRNMMEILSSIRDAHISDSTTADTSGTEIIKEMIEEANNFKGSREEAQVSLFLKGLGIKYNKLSKDEFVTLTNILQKSNMLISPDRKRGKGKSKKKR